MGEAWHVTKFGDPAEALELVELPPEILGPADVRITTAANGLNALDVGMCRGTHPLRPAPPFVLGAEVVGVVTETGAAVTRLAPGDRVVAMNRRARVEPGEWVFVNAAAGALGSAVVQIAQAHGGRVVAAAGSEQKRRACTKLGAEAVVDSRDGAFAAHVRDATGGHGADVVCDLVGGDVFASALEAAAFEARVLTMGWAGGTMPELDPMTLIVRNLAVFGMSWGSSYPREAPGVVRDVHARILALVASGEVRPLVGSVVPHVELPQALEAIRAGATVGKSVATWD
jgi:NADPH:quinone reductase